MSDYHARTPSGAANWASHHVDLGDGRTAAVLTLPEHRGESTYVMAAAPRLVRSAAGRPHLNLSLVLERQPDPAEANIRPLIQRGVLTMDVQTGVEASVVETLNAQLETPVQRLFARQVTYRLLLESEPPAADAGADDEPGNEADSGGLPAGGGISAPPGIAPRSNAENTPPAARADAAPVLARAEGSGTEGRAGLSAHLNRQQTLSVLGALEGRAGPMRLCAALQYRVAASARRVHLSGSWAAIYDFIQAQAADGRIEEAALHALVPQMAAEHLIDVTDDTGAPVDLPAEALVRYFMRQSAVILHREPGMIGSGTVYVLRARPHESFRLSQTEAYSGAGYATHEICAALHDLIGGALEDQPWDDHVHLVAVNPDRPGQVTPVPRRVPSHRAERARRNGTAASSKVAVLGNSITSVSLATRPSLATSVQAHALLSSNTTLSLSTSVLDDLRVELPSKDQPRSLPIIPSDKAPVWQDRVHRNKVWYAPAFELVMPDPSAPASEESPYLFSYERTGVTSSGEPALRGEVRFTLRQTVPTATEAALSRMRKVSAHPVAPTSLYVALAIPFVDEADGSVKTHRFRATLDEGGATVTARVELLNDWVRLAYGALAVEGFQSRPAQVEVAYTFTGYVPTKQQDLQVAFGAKTLQTPVVFSSAEAATLRGQTYLDASRLTYVQPTAEVQYQRDAARSNEHRAGNGHAAARDVRPAAAGSATALATAATVAATPITIRPAQPQGITHQPALTVRPAVKPVTLLTAKPLVTSEVATVLTKVKYATRTHVRRQAVAALVPCSPYGRFYREGSGEAATPIGCRDALTLGQTQYRLYEEMPELRDPAYRVYRSLQQPGRFLVAATQFCISRRAAGEDDGYRPLIFLNALLDAEVAENNRVELRATLQPDIEPFQQHALRERLRAHDPEPVLEYLPDLPTEAVEVSWHLDAAIGATSETDPLDVSGPFMGTYFQMDLASWQLMRSVINSPGIRGSARFTLSDGTAIDANLLIKLDHVRGPWTTGPVGATAEGGGVRLINHIERTLDVSHLARYDASGEAERVPVEQSLEAHQAHMVSSAAVAQIPVYSYPPGDPVALEEIRSYVEEIYSNIIFINLLRFANHNLIRLDVEARIEGIDGLHRAQLTEEMPVADIPIILPLTTYLERRLLEFRVTKLFSDRAAEATDWMQWDLDVTVPVSLTREVIGLQHAL